MKAEYKIIADHLRSSCFLIADGALPSNEGRGYVLRRIMRRAMRQLHKLGARQASMYKFVDALIEQMGAAYPELARAREVIVETLKNEEEKFRETLEKGLKILEEEINNLAKGAPLAGAIAFKLYDTYGFPLDLTQDILREKNLTVDIEEFNREMELQRERAKANWKGSGEQAEDKNILELQAEFGATKFLGYDNLESKAKIIYLSVNGQRTERICGQDNEKNIIVILDQTPFYATSGGQKGDDGKITTANNKLEISEVKKVGKLFIHQIKNITGEFKINDDVSAQVNPQTRHARACNHSATHLMHKALKLILGNSISQKGSNVDSDYFTFDFNFNRAMTKEEIAKVEDLVNFYIAQNSPAKTEIMALDKARQHGAEALFGEKYDNEVRVVTMGEMVEEFNSSGLQAASTKANDTNKPYSIELCGGTHVKSTGEIEFFKIISEKSIASGIRRIEAKSGIGAKEYVIDEFQELQKENFNKAQKISTIENEINLLKNNKSSSKINQESDKIIFDIKNFDYKEIQQNINLLLQEIADKDNKTKALQKQVEQLKKQNLLQDLSKIQTQTINNIKLLSHVFENVEAKDLREIVVDLKNRKDFNQSCIFVIFGLKEDKVSAIVAISDNLLDKFDANILIKDVILEIGGKGGGGKKDLAMGGGSNADGVANAIESVRKLII